MAVALSGAFSRLALSPPSPSPHHQKVILQCSSTKPGALFPSSFLGKLSAASLSAVAWGWGSFPSSSSRSPPSTTAFSVTAYNVQIMVEENEPEEALLRRFRREVSRAGIIQECKRRRFFENKQELKKRKAREAGRRNRRRRSTPSSPPSAADDSARAKKTADEEDDNWDLPEGDLPF
ncbi:30S ribosomal protein S21, chloroplastic-like [Nymphaea colorata]|nr:30S ribosomal protein S21, chloroplastic-like [Nymphaea colorata]